MILKDLCIGYGMERELRGLIWSLLLEEKERLKKLNCKMRYFILLALIFLGFSEVKSQGALSVGDAVELALSNNFQVLIAEKNVEVAKNNFSKGQAGYYPSITFKLNNSNSITDNQDPSSFINGLFSSNRVTPNIDLQWVLFDGLRVRANYQQLAKLSELSEGNEIVILQMTIQGVLLSYYNILLQEERLESNRVVLELSKDRFRYFETKKNLGAAVTFDLLQAKNAMLNDSTIVISQRLELNKAVRELNRLMVVDLETEWFFSDSLVAIPAPYEYNVLKESMLSSNANLRVQYVNQELKNVALKQSKADLYPSLIFNPGASYTYSHFDGTLPNGSDVITDGSSTNYYANLALSFNLYNGGKTRRTIKNARIDIEIAQLSTEELKQSLEAELANQFNTWQVMMEALIIARENLESAELNIQIATEKYKNGSITSFEFRDVQKTYLLVSLTKLQAEYNVIASQTELLRLSGNILRERGA
jgi:outer membrane protein TolC